jgi:predicted GNAT family acetyltransferase
VNRQSVRHDEDASRFVVEHDGAEGYLRYRRIDDDVVDFRSTFVPRELRGRGLAEHLVRAAFAWAEAEGLRVIPSCSYVQRLVGQNPHLRPLTTG